MNLGINSQFWAYLRQQRRVWQAGAMPGLFVMSCVAIARLSGSLQPLEWMAFDALLRSRSLEPPDARVVIVGITEADIRAIGTYPIPDQTLARLIQTLQRYQPRAIGLDLFRDLTRDPQRSELSTVLKHCSNLIGIEAGLADVETLRVKPPPELPPERVGLADTIVDADGKLRRSLLASKVDSGDIRYSMPLLLAKLYLQPEGVSFRHGNRASQPIYFGQMELPRFRKNTGGYVNAAAGGNQILLNFRRHPQPFPVVSLMDVLNDRVDASRLRDRIVLIGTTAVHTNNDTFTTSATHGTLITNDLGAAASQQYQLIYGVEHLAHATSQIISAVRDGRPLLRTWADGWEYAWILSWGMGGMTLGLLLQSPWKTLLSIGLGSTAVVGIGYGLLTLSWWVPIVPTLLAVWGAGLTTAFFNQRDRLLLEQRSLVLKRTYDAVHNGPLQTLASLLRNLDGEAVPAEQLRSQLQGLNQELRSVFESMHLEVERDEFYAKTPIQDLLYQIYESTISRDLPGFATIKLFIPPDFSALQDCPLTADQKQALCVFLQEALCNVGKHAVDVNRLEVICTQEPTRYRLQVIDDGKGLLSTAQPQRKGRGTMQAEELARHLHGRFERHCQKPGTRCELTWAKPRNWLKSRKWGK